MSFFYLCSCLSTQFLYRTAVKATFNVKDNINAIIKNSITLTINITTLPTKNRKIGGKTTSAYSHFLCHLFYNIIITLSTNFIKFINIFLTCEKNYYFYSLFKKFITKSIITSFSFGFDSAISNVKAVNVLLSIICCSFLYRMP